MRASGEKFLAFFVAILYSFSQWGKKHAYFLPIGEKICILFTREGRKGGQTEKYTPLYI